MRSLRTAAAVAVAGTMLATGSLALAAGGSTHPTTGAAAHGGPIKVFISQRTETKGTITITGAIGDYGTAISTDKNGKVDGNGSFEQLHLKHGGLFIDGTGLNKAFAHVHPQFNSDNCSFSFSASGPTKIVSGTGAYAGATGSVRVTVTFAGIGPKLKSGKCNQANNAPSFGNYDTITGSGNIAIN
jgi:hypothetical protein